MLLKGLMLIRQANQKCDVCHCWYFLIKDFMFRPNVCNKYHDLMSMNLSDIAILSMKGADYCMSISGISKNTVINLMENANLTEKSRT